MMSGKPGHPEDKCKQSVDDDKSLGLMTTSTEVTTPEPIERIYGRASGTIHPLLSTYKPTPNQEPSSQY